MLRFLLRILWAGGLIGIMGPAGGLQAQSSSDSDAPPADNATSPTAQPDVPTDIDHVLCPQDVLRIQIFQEDDINKQCDGLIVSQELQITLPLIGSVSVKGKTIRETRELIRALYDKDYLVNPQVNIKVLKYGDRTVNVLGSVTKQGRFSFRDTRDMSIIDALALAGGQTRLADLHHVRLTRVNANGESETTIIDVDAMTKKGDSNRVMLQPGDVVYVPERIL